MCAALKGYRMIITLPEKMSQEKVSVLKSLGAEIIRTPTEAAWDSPESHIGVALRLNKEIANSHILNQYSNPSNPLAHYDQTAEEILDQCDEKLDAIVAGAGTGGTISGIGRKIKEKLPSCQIVGVDPIGSIFERPETLNGVFGSYQVEGIGGDFIPKVLDHNVIDHWIKTADKESIIMARRLVREEGLLCGMSSGTAVLAAIQYIKANKLGKGHRVVVVLPDSVRNYMSKFMNSDWMICNNFIDSSHHLEPPFDRWWCDQTVEYLKLNTPFTISPFTSCQEAMRILKNEGFHQLPVVDPITNQIHGTVTEGNLLALISYGHVKCDEPVSKALFRQFRQVSLSTPLGELSRFFDRNHFALVVASQQRHSSAGIATNIDVIIGVVTRIDLLNYIVDGQSKQSS